MKNITNAFLISCILLCNYCIAQENIKQTKPYLSSEVYCVYPHYFTEYTNQFNYGFGTSISENFKPFKVTLGLFYSKKKYFELYEGTSGIDKITYNLDYYNVPFLISFPLVRDTIKKSSFLISTGIVFNIPNNYNSTTYYKAQQLVKKNDSPTSYKSGSSLRISMQTYRRLNELFAVYAGLFGDYKFQLDQLQFSNSKPQWHPSYSEDRFLVGLNIGIELKYKKR
jgi:hypothetical protein